MNVLDETQLKMKDALEHLKQELRNLRTNRANPGMLDSIQVEVYGSQMKIRDLATVSVGDSRVLVVTAYDASTAGPISKAIEKQLSFQPILEGNVVRIPVPPMSEEVRKEMAKQARQEGEKTKITIRDIRRKNNELVRKQKAEGEITEDIQKKSEKKIQELTDEYCKMADQITKEKEKEIMAV
ncbi:MAG: ribosome recycling factor [Simkaniaceae bacterium]